MAKNTTTFASARSAGEAFLGVEVSWDLGEYAMDMQIPRNQFERLFIEAGANPDMFKPVETPKNNLPRASKVGFSHALGIDSRLIDVKQLSRPDKDTLLAFGVYYRISVEGERDRWELGARVRIDSATELAVVVPPQGDSAYPDENARKWGEAMADYANRAPSTAFNNHVSNALIDFGKQLGWVGRRTSGGVYFLPGELGERFVRVLDGLNALTQDNPVKFHGDVTPQYADPRTLSTWARRTTVTFDAEIDTLTAKLKDMTSRDNTRESSFDLRVMECNALIHRAEQYAAVLEDKLDPLKAELEKLRTAFGDAQAKLQEAKAKGEQAFGSIQALADAAQAKSERKATPRKRTRKARPAGPAMPSKDQLDRLFQVG